jgi:MFS family permease
MGAISVTFAGFGFATASWASRIPQVRAALHVSPGVLGLILLFGAAGSAISVPLAGIAVARFGEARVVAASAIIAAAGLAVVAVGYLHGTAAVAAGLFGFGFGAGAGDVSMNVQGTAVERSVGRAILPKFHAGWSVGTVAGAGLGTAMIAWHVPVTVHLLAVAIVVGVTMPAVTRSYLPPAAQPPAVQPVQPPAVQPVQPPAVQPVQPPAAQPAQAPAAPPPAVQPPRSGRAVAEAGRKSPLAAWTEPRTLMIGLFVLSVTVMEGAGNSWLSLGVIDGYRASAVLGSTALAVFLAAMTLGRWFGPHAIDRFGRVSVLRASVAVALAGLLLIGFGHYLLVAMAGAVLMGLGISLGFPVGMSAAADDPRYAAGRVSTAASLGYVAFLGGPPAIGALADGVGILHAMLLAGVLLIAALFFARATRPLAV